ncbi:Ketopantoate reductase ApbA/PanE [Penicillium griseofulvum]|uniref:2-dehydropantoate 2-reductase n=1 Tax=Penicillium patulum TaxID=5078 RepID=A0A135L9V3_PENPA|nr:Ketopantoate reductase ApbA/PanE [Penicillium griseofulvum]KXG45768.1 Ketopantoate reductase ApbA/PanE [Penicillium griseofulvum]
MQSTFRPRSLWRTGFLDTCLRSRFQIYSGPNTRFISTWKEELDEVNHDTKTPLSGRVHILGMGNLGCFFAHSLATRRSPPPITICLHNDYLYQAFVRKRGQISVSTHGLDDVRTGFDVETVDEEGRWYTMPPVDKRPSFDSEPQSLPDNGPIECLIICTKAHHTELAIKDISHRLTKDSTICLVHNGMGVLDSINQNVFPDPNNRPHYIQTVFSHGLGRNDSFKISHLGVGTTILSPVGDPSVSPTTPEADHTWAPSTKYLLRLLTLTPPLVAVADTPAGLLQYQLEKLAVNCVINPLTALSDCTNGEILYSFSFTRVMRLLLFEISAVICALPELQGIPGIEDRFSPERLRRLVVNIASNTAKNHSSMQQDINQRRLTEIEYFNGWIVRRGEELGIKCALNYMIKHLVAAKAATHRSREAGAIPLDLDNVISTNEPPI